MATQTAEGGSATVCETEAGSQVDNREENSTTLKLKLQKKDKTRKKIQWTEDTIDNEGLGKKKSKCCCQYTKPRKDLDCSSSEDEEDCDHCDH